MLNEIGLQVDYAKLSTNTRMIFHVETTTIYFVYNLVYRQNNLLRFANTYYSGTQIVDTYFDVSTSGSKAMKVTGMEGQRVLSDVSSDVITGTLDYYGIVY